MVSATRSVTAQPPLWAYGWWLLVSALLCFGFLAQFTIGAPFFLAGLALGGLGLVRPATRSVSLTALPAGAALPLLYVAWLNKGGPGTICTTAGTTTSCEEQWNPWLWILAAGLLIAFSAGLVVLTRLVTPKRQG